ncbi:PQQ-like beta-propeller repeat protein [Streptomyces sp. NBC_00638]|uniref:outer membrane protein assembly factor BamB family protein n=1 Tax=unclassified Streptomyces TaxID=2593676 RepID=UPI00224CBF97|nr:PQQ-binding-like beta-propeller repeat protein [Streptomyces sp. NBC_00638]MCX5008449.1 PQQ-like beta-propeller repeat protein [Streptomyces sp. NBC_00638]
MAVTFLLAAVTIPALAACGTDSGPPRAVAAPTASAAEPGPFGPRSLASQPRDLSSKPIAVGAGVVLTLPDDRTALIAYDPATGAERWRSPARSWYAEQAWPAGSDFIVSWTNVTPDGSDRSVVGDFVARLNGRTGKPVWATRVSEAVSRAGDIRFRPRAGAVLVSGASSQGWVAALDLESGRMRWTRDGYLRTADDFGSGDFGGTYALLYEPSDSYTDAGRLIRVDPRKGTVRWTVVLGKANGTTVYSVRRHVVVSRRGSDGDGTVLFLDGATGKRVARVPGEVRAEDDNIVVVASEKGVAAYDQTGDKRWELAGTVIADRQQGFSDGRTVYLLTGGEDEGARSLVALDARSGKKVAYLARQTQAELLGTVNGFLVAKNPYGDDALIFPGEGSRA